MAANDRQVGGAHYMGGPVQHWDLSALFQWDPMQYQIIKYTMRWRDKNGLLDLEKVGHFVEKYIEDVKAGRMPGPGEYPLKPHGRGAWLAVLAAVPLEEYKALKEELDRAQKELAAYIEGHIISVELDEEQVRGIRHHVDTTVRPVQNAMAVDFFKNYNLRRGFNAEGTRQLTLGGWIAAIGGLPDEYMVVPKEAVKSDGWRDFTFEGSKGGPDGEMDWYRCKRCREHFTVKVNEPPVEHTCAPVMVTSYSFENGIAP